jgi:hypothetical protein
MSPNYVSPWKCITGSCNRVNDATMLLQRRRTGAAAEIVAERLLVQNNRFGVTTHQGVAAAKEPVIFWTFFASLRITNPEVTSMAPRIAIQAPTTTDSVSTESKG